MKTATMPRTLSTFCLVLVWGLQRAAAADYFVATLGSDANVGTALKPFRTITHAYRQAAPGVTIHVSPGVYLDYTKDWGIHLSATGTATSPIVVKSDVKGGAIIDGQDAADRNQGFYIDGSHNTVDGFEIRNCPHGGIAVYGNGNQIINNEIHHNGNPPSTSPNGRDGVYSDRDTRDNHYAANSIHDNGRPGSNLDHGLYLCGQNETVVNNVVFRNAACGLQIAGYTTVRGMKAYNNVIAWNGTSGIILWMNLAGVSIQNNILYRNRHWGLGSYDAHGSGVVVDHNLCSGNGQGDYDFTGGGSDFAYRLGITIPADPHFVNGTSASFDAHLRADSPAGGAALNLSSVFSTDKDGVRRSNAGRWDLGAYVLGRTGRPIADLHLTNPASVQDTNSGR